MNLHLDDNALSELIRNIVKDEVKKALPQKEWLTLEEVCNTFNLAKNNVKNKKWRDCHGFPYHQPLGIYGSVHYQRTEIEDWLNGKTAAKC